MAPDESLLLLYFVAVRLKRLAIRLERAAGLAYMTPPAGKPGLCREFWLGNRRRKRENEYQSHGEQCHCSQTSAQNADGSQAICVDTTYPDHASILLIHGRRLDRVYRYI